MRAVFSSAPVRLLKTLVLLLMVLYEGQAVEICRTGFKPDNKHRGNNQEKSGRPLYWLDLHRAIEGYLPSNTYTFRLKSAAKDIPFSDAVIKAEAVGDCGTGNFHDNTSFLYQPRNCPQIIMTNNKQPMTKVPFKWTAPNCGCVTFRTTVIRNGEMYYYDDDKAIDGNLVKTVCPHGERLTEQLLSQDYQTTIPTSQTSPKLSKLSRAARLQLLCKVTNRLKSNEILHRPVFLARRSLLNSSLVTLLNIELALEQRRTDILQCCNKEENKKISCFNDIRRHRIDQFCGDGSPRIPFIKAKSDFMRKREAECCWRFGESRYNCFNTSDDLVSPLETNDYSMDFSEDESDPVNDISDYPSEVSGLEAESKTQFFVAKIPTSPATSISTTSTSIPPTRPLTTPGMPTVSPRQINATHLPMRRVRPASPSAVAVKHQVNLGDMAYRVRRPSATSSVEITMQALEQKVWVSSLRLECCQEGQSFAASAHKGDVWKSCRLAAKRFRKAVRQGKKICSNSYQRCCFEQYITLSQEENKKSTNQRTDPAKDVSTHQPTEPQITTRVGAAIENRDMSSDVDNSALDNVDNAFGEEDASDDDGEMENDGEVESDDDIDDDNDDEDVDEDVSDEEYPAEQLDYPQEDTRYRSLDFSSLLGGSSWRRRSSLVPNIRNRSSLNKKLLPPVQRSDEQKQRHRQNRRTKRRRNNGN